MHSLIELDKMLFQGINGGLSNPVFDFLLPILRQPLTWAPLYVFILAFIVQNFPKGWLIALGLLATVGLTDFTSSELIKKSVQRARPCNDMSMESRVVERIHCGSGYSFPSSHASNHFSIALFLIVVLGHISRYIKPVLLIWAASIAFSQVYVGVHFPIDVTVGALLGTGIGWLGGRVFRKILAF